MTKQSKEDKKEDKTVKENKSNEKDSKEKSELKQDKKGIMLITFKDIANIDNMTYQGFKAHLKVEDADKFKESELKKKLDEYKSKSVFIT